MTKRPQFKRVTKASKIREIFGKLSPEVLADFHKLQAKLKAAKIKTSNSDIYRIRKEFLDTNGDNDVLKNMLLVKRTAEQVGGLTQLKSLIGYIERLV